MNSSHRQDQGDGQARESRLQEVLVFQRRMRFTTWDGTIADWSDSGISRIDGIVGNEQRVNGIYLCQVREAER